METQSIEIDKGLIELCHSKKERWHTLKGFIMDMVLLGIQTKYKDLTTYDTMKTDRQKEKNKEEREVFYTSKVENIINKEKSKKEKKWVFTKEQIPDFPFKSYKSLIINFWAEKSGAKSEEAFKLLIGKKGLRGIYDKYGDNAVKDQLEEAIANKWQSITLKNYEAYGRPKNADKEPVTGHPAQRRWKDGGFVDQ